ncbi:hypothetical protein VNO78_22821 [Psophocarpus tetragonolobus]|uniref:Uncharacterized protein n=1 Tax=Psophocarpus tetragonolobus TaxID=3891 RepID=A0AAN9XCP4_PSOTE
MSGERAGGSGGGEGGAGACGDLGGWHAEAEGNRGGYSVAGLRGQHDLSYHGGSRRCDSSFGDFVSVRHQSRQAKGIILFTSTPLPISTTLPLGKK